jgi:hypothetical protein
VADCAATLGDDSSVEAISDPDLKACHLFNLTPDSDENPIFIIGPDLKIKSHPEIRR